jgi:hypothetical protein
LYVPIPGGALLIPVKLKEFPTMHKESALFHEMEKGLLTTTVMNAVSVQACPGFTMREAV